MNSIESVAFNMFIMLNHCINIKRIICAPNQYTNYYLYQHEYTKIIDHISKLIIPCEKQGNTPLEQCCILKTAVVMVPEERKYDVVDNLIQSQRRIQELCKLISDNKRELNNKEISLELQKSISDNEDELRKIITYILFTEYTGFINESSNLFAISYHLIRKNSMIYSIMHTHMSNILYEYKSQFNLDKIFSIAYLCELLGLSMYDCYTICITFLKDLALTDYSYNNIIMHNLYKCISYVYDEIIKYILC